MSAAPAEYADPRAELTILILGKTAPRAADAIIAAGYVKPEPRVVVRSIEHLAALPHGTALMTAARSIVQVLDDPELGHWLTYMATDESDSLNPIDLAWNHASRHTLTLLLPCIIIPAP